MKSYEIMLREANIQKNDILDVSSDLAKLILHCKKLGEQFDANEILEILKDLVGEDGTLLVRAFNWDFCSGFAFDIRRSPSRAGALGNVALKRADFKRSRHSLYSWFVWGKYQKEIVGLENVRSFGADSPFAFLKNHNGKQLMLGSDMYNSLTYVHFVEEQVGVRYRYQKNFTGEYVDENGLAQTRVYSMNVRDLDMDVRMFNHDRANLFPFKFEDEFREKGILTSKIYEDVFTGVLQLKPAFEIIKDDILYNDSKRICLFKGQK